MLQNLRVDVLYYRTATDFEMEFNLGGCCHMRMFTDKTDTRKGLVSLLARAVSRSRVIIVCGPLFGEKGLISTVAAAVGKPLVAADNAAFGIESDEKIEIIDGSMPLVTAEGFFGGCILESGPQTIVLLTENKSIRKSIMKKLIHPYITEISYSAFHEGENIPAKPPVPTPVAEPENTPEEEPVIDEVAEEEPVEEVSTEETAEEEIVDDEPFEINMDAALEDELRKEIEAEVNGINLEDIEDEEEIKTAPEEPKKLSYTPSPSYEYENETEFTPVNPVNVWIIVLLVMLLLVIGVIAYLLVFIPLKDGIDIQTYIRSLFEIAN